MSMEFRLGLAQARPQFDICAEPFASGRYDYGELLEPAGRERLKWAPAAASSR